jgi:hypothetical protein
VTSFRLGELGGILFFLEDEDLTLPSLLLRDNLLRSLREDDLDFLDLKEETDFCLLLVVLILSLFIVYFVLH